jgi:hypothetical protein
MDRKLLRHKIEHFYRLIHPWLKNKKGAKMQKDIQMNEMRRNQSTNKLPAVCTN